MRFLCPAVGPPLAQTNGLADAIAEVVQLGPPRHTAALHDDLADLGRMEGEFPLHSLSLHDAADGKCLPAAAAGTGDHDTGINLHPLLLALENTAVHVDRVANLEMRDFRL